jgi:hypothetical protein
MKYQVRYKCFFTGAVGLTTLQYRAPEMCDLYQKKGLSEKVDIWVCFKV